MTLSPDKQSFLNLIQLNKRIVFKICHSYCSNKSDREDLAQEIVYQLWKSYHSYDTRYLFTTWMYRVALNVAISFYRQEKKVRPALSLSEHLLEIEDDQPDQDELQGDLNLLHQFIYGLKELDRALMILYLEEKTYKEIADILGISETNVATKISRIKEKLKKMFITIKK